MEPKEEFWIIFKQISKAPKEFKDEGNILTNLIGGEKYPRKLRTVTKPITIRRANNYLAKMIHTQDRNCIKTKDWPEYDAD